MSRRPAHARVGATPADVIVVTFLCVMGFTALLAADEAADEQSRRTKCASNLRMVGQAMMLYANESKGQFPRTRFDPEKAEKVAFYTGWKAANPFGEDGPDVNDVTAAMFLLLRTQDLKSDVFVCPGTDQTPIKFGPAEGGAGAAGAPGSPVAASAAFISNFPSPRHLSYSYMNTYPGRQAMASGIKFNFTLSSDFAVAADLNPGGEQVATLTAEQMPPATPPANIRPAAPPQPVKLSDTMKKANSPNHGGLGQNVLYADGHVDFQPTPFCGMPRGRDQSWVRENIYTRHLADAPGAGAPEAAKGDPILGPPMDEKDGILLPVAAPKEHPAAAPK